MKIYKKKENLQKNWKFTKQWKNLHKKLKITEKGKITKNWQFTRKIKNL